MLEPWVARWRTSGKVRNPERLASAVEILRCAYNLIRLHARLCLGLEPRTPAMQAGIFNGLLSWRSVFEWPGRPRSRTSFWLARWPSGSDRSGLRSHRSPHHRGCSG